MYSKALIAARGGRCFKCGTGRKLIVHHIDRNRANNLLSNLDVLCRKCHAEAHKNKAKIIHIEIPPRYSKFWLIADLNDRFEWGFELMSFWDKEDRFSAEDIVQFMEEKGLLRRQE